jgi:uncharacterized lipoprotein YddW (UPF0748 family)
MKTRILIPILVAIGTVAVSCSPAQTPAQMAGKSLYMWFDCEANYERLSTPDSIAHYLDRVAALGFTDVVVDVKSIMGETLYDSAIAPYMGEWKGTTRARDYDMMGIFITEGHRRGLGVHGSLNVFAGGHNFFDRGVIYTDHPQWQSQVYWQGEIIPISSMKWNYNGMMNPANPEVQRYQLDILAEFAAKYPEVDGVILDRVRFDNITSDFSPLSRELFEKYAGIRLADFPDDVLYWEKTTGKDGADQWEWKRGPHFNKWVEWRAMVIREFVGKVHDTLKEVNPDMAVGDYTGAWYPTYYQLGVNWASREYDPSTEFDWATPEYKNSGYAELLDIYMTGLYYTHVTKADVDNANAAVGARGEPGQDPSRNYWYSIEGGAALAREITRGVVPVTGSIYVEQYDGDAALFERAVEQAIVSSDGLMVFDIVHIINRDWWEPLRRGVENGIARATETQF